ncbi:MAG: hypothetical protein A3E37_02885 [Candidatus Andersenbacteria bacterium RIFCSPHIGHO2_12_FULL_46_9]|uniref:Phosphatidylglycerol lysyltransferase C-terminal domain-containing protein n=1 Tax=Candidatus Daviesbacteria bacterium GW2011_GWF2_38_6 TaxID=1618432 RepID=A0A0G0NGF3_9BACT|nr:MAG: hypothetical protein US99_C0083G0006 [Candidatus Daviesbacteria bacterium GW2011_GWF2_38_6]KKT93329.1 MAG: hypothetical protein UW94_C0007G0014 [Parcubacteria group bacterium GW2011_GWA2_45_14]OGY33011.1 MAG: hypothetical protein A3B76_01200 [Candidatus Andersenbacteria bacterium RIFCSPHIGHO2_02_FULL_46_16]OGY36544.1 MAG: hypothetical protein A3E37_02885 [Candidatus Andersenbacteria bacterium RIFCSPHIGHO2_12_FULL_46_9]OGY37146.1 MAG: hypothetical protein A3I08_02180 [Candidatus Andersen
MTNVIPQFPNFKKIELADRSAIESFTQDFLPYSDYNFTSLWIWNVKNGMQFSQLDKNLIVKFTDYFTGEPFYSFLGHQISQKALGQLFDFIDGEGQKQTLRLVPEECIQGIRADQFTIKEDPNNFDYILSIPELMTYGGRSLRGKKNFVNRFHKLYRSTMNECDLGNPNVQMMIQELFSFWAKQKGFEPEKVDEFLPFQRLLESAKSFQLVTIGVFVDNQLIGFSISEVVGMSYALLHFEKADATSFIGIYPFLRQETARALAARGCRYLNLEQDAGLPGLREAKKGYRPCLILKKYTITPFRDQIP